MRKMLLVVSVFLVNQAMAQTEGSRFKSVVDKFGQYYNEENYDSLYYNFSPSMQEHMPLEKSHEFFGNLYSDAGRMVNRQIIETRSLTSSYKTSFERGTFMFDITLDKAGKISGFVFKPYLSENFPELIRNESKLILPFKGSWKVVWGGDTRELNYHAENNAQKNAFDFLIMGDDGHTYRGDGQSNEDYFAFGQEIVAPCEGEVVLVVDGIKDNAPGSMNPVYIPGNTVILKSKHHEFLVFAHLMQYSIKVKPGDTVMPGQVLGLCGNSGNSSEPHLHFHIQNVEDINQATGAKAYFERILVDGKLKIDYSPIQGEIVEPAN